MGDLGVAGSLWISCSLRPRDTLFTLGGFHQGVHFPTLTNLYCQPKLGLGCSDWQPTKHTPQALGCEAGPSSSSDFHHPHSALSYLVSPAGKLHRV